MTRERVGRGSLRCGFALIALAVMANAGAQAILKLGKKDLHRELGKMTLYVKLTDSRSNPLPIKQPKDAFTLRVGAQDIHPESYEMSMASGHPRLALVVDDTLPTDKAEGPAGFAEVRSAFERALFVFKDPETRFSIFSASARGGGSSEGFSYDQASAHKALMSLQPGAWTGRDFAPEEGKGYEDRHLFDAISVALSQTKGVLDSDRVAIFVVVRGPDVGSNATFDSLLSSVDAIRTSWISGAANAKRPRAIFILDLSANPNSNLKKLAEQSGGEYVWMLSSSGKDTSNEPIRNATLRLLSHAEQSLGYDAYYLHFKVPSSVFDGEGATLFWTSDSKQSAQLPINTAEPVSSLVYVAIGLLLFASGLAAWLVFKPKSEPLPPEHREAADRGPIPEPADAPEIAGDRGFALRIVGGAKDGADEAFHHSMDLGRLGSDPISRQCAEDSAMSKTHARIFLSHDGYYLKDLDSTNGTWLRPHLGDGTHGEKVRVRQARKLNDKDLILMGETVVQFEDTYTHNIASGAAEAHDTHRLKK